MNSLRCAFALMNHCLRIVGYECHQSRIEPERVFRSRFLVALAEVRIEGADTLTLGLGWFGNRRAVCNLTLPALDYRPHVVMVLHDIIADAAKLLGLGKERMA